MICPTCGSELNEGLKFCTQCGTPIETEAPVEPVAEVNTAEVIEEAPAFEADASAEAPVLEADVYSPEFAQEPVFDGNYESVPPYEATPEAFNQIPEATIEPEKPEDKKPLIFGIIAVVAGALSLVFSCCGIYATCFSIPLSVVAIVMGILGIIFSKKANNKTAFILSIVGLALPVLGVILAVVLAALGLGGSLLAGLAEGYYYY